MFLYIGKTCCLTGYANKQFEFEFESKGVGLNRGWWEVGVGVQGRGEEGAALVSEVGRAGD